MLINDGQGKNGPMGVNAESRGKISSSNAERGFFAARDKGLSYSAVYIFDAAATEHVAYLKNTSTDKNLFIGNVSIGTVNSVLFKLFFATGTATTGETVIPVPTNKARTLAAPASAIAGDTAIASLGVDGLVGIQRTTSNATVQKDYKGLLQLGPGEAVVWEYDTGSSGIGEIEALFHFEDIV